MILDPALPENHKQLVRFGFLTTLLASTIALNLTACLPITPFPMNPTETFVPTTTKTATIVWFPPTETPFFKSTVTPSPTPEIYPGIGGLIAEDSFDDLSIWEIGRNGFGTVAAANNEISLVLTNPREYLYTYRTEPIFTDMFAEVTVEPTICSGDAEFGLLIRYNSPDHFYRFSITCDGRTRLDKLNDGTASSPQPWLSSPSIPQAAQRKIRLAIWVKGTEMRFFIDGEFLFSISDPTFKSGMIGLFTRSAGTNALSVSFSDLFVYQVLTD